MTYEAERDVLLIAFLLVCVAGWLLIYRRR
jgi:hypothetical protein